MTGRIPYASFYLPTVLTLNRIEARHFRFRVLTPANEEA